MVWAFEKYYNNCNNDSTQSMDAEKRKFPVFIKLPYIK